MIAQYLAAVLSVFKYRASVLFFQAVSYLSFLKVLIQLVLVKFWGLSILFREGLVGDTID